MRVLHLGKYLPPQPGGIERFLGELLPAQRRLGLRVAALGHAGAVRQRPDCRRQDGAVVVRAPVAATLAYTPLSVDFPCRLLALIRRWRPDLLHLHLPNPSAFWALALPAARRLPWLLHWHADVPADALSLQLRLLYRLYKPLESALLRRAGAVVATSAAYAGSSAPLRRWQGKVAVVPLGLADAGAGPVRPEPALWPQADGLRILFVGRFSYYKGLAHLVRALAMVDGASLVLVGAGEQDAVLRRQVASLGLGSRVAFAGALPDAALADAYAAADVVCLPSIERSEAFGLVLLEAMRAGVATVATSVTGSGMAEVVEHGRAGLLVPPGDAEALAAALRGLRDDPVMRRRLGAAGRARFDAHFGIDPVAARLDALYRDLVARAR
jgi:glycosyltransferase involved in cell wall biosynthesis